METAVALSKSLAILFLVLSAWVVISLPLLAGFYFVARGMRKRRVTSTGTCALFALVAALVVAPVPTPIITFFLPSAFFFLVDRSWMGHFLLGLLPWIGTSIAITFIVAYALITRFVASFDRRADNAV